jgi:hypothetical protein
VSTGRRGLEREIRGMGVESGERRKVLVIIKYSSTNRKKNVFGAEGGEKVKGLE